MKKIYSLSAVMGCLVASTLAFATPREVIVITHSDELNLSDAGMSLSAKGIVRASNFAFYFLNKFGTPDVIIVPKFADSDESDSSTREIQTIAPLANLLAERFPARNQTRDFPIVARYIHDDYKKMAEYVLKNDRFNNKLVLICWDQKKNDNIAKELGVTGSVVEWDSRDYNSVYDIKYDTLGNVSQFDNLKDQYSVAFNGTWDDFNNIVK